MSREELRAALWPDTHVDFEASLHFCVRQVRQALGDSAASPRYVQTVPRRGYRLLTPVEPAGATPVARDARSPRRPRTRKAVLSVATAAIVVLAALAVWRSVDRAPLRIAIMPFQPPAGAIGDASWPGVAEWILEGLHEVAGRAVAIVGPTSTAAYQGTAADIARLASDYEVQYVLNGRFLDVEQGPQMLAELIRISDGAHVWVRSFDRPQNGRALGLRIGRDVADALGLGTLPDAP